MASTKAWSSAACALAATSARLAPRFGREGCRARIGHPDLNRPQALLAQPSAMGRTFHALGDAADPTTCGYAPIWLHVTCHGPIAGASDDQIQIGWPAQVVGPRHRRPHPVRPERSSQ